MPPHCDHCEAVHPLADVVAGAALVVVVLVLEVMNEVDEVGLVVVLLTGAAELLLLTGAEPREGVC